MIRDLVFNPELAEPSVGQVNPDLSAEPPFRSKREYVADDQHPDHQHWINPRPASVRIERRQLFVHPTQVEQAIDLPYQMIRRHHLVEIKRIKELPLAALLPSQHASLPQMPVSNRTESRAAIRLNMSFATLSRVERTCGVSHAMSPNDPTETFAAPERLMLSMPAFCSIKEPVLDASMLS